MIFLTECKFQFFFAVRMQVHEKTIFFEQNASSSKNIAECQFKSGYIFFLCRVVERKLRKFVENEDFIVWIRKSQLKIKEIWGRKPAAGEKNRVRPNGGEFF